jgi:hypothetical protein
MKKLLVIAVAAFVLAAGAPAPAGAADFTDYNFARITGVEVTLNESVHIGRGSCVGTLSVGVLLLGQDWHDSGHVLGWVDFSPDTYTSCGTSFLFMSYVNGSTYNLSSVYAWGSGSNEFAMANWDVRYFYGGSVTLCDGGITANPDISPPPVGCWQFDIGVKNDAIYAW